MKLYTLEEARALLPRVIPVVESIRTAALAMRQLQERAAGDARKASGNGHVHAPVPSAQPQENPAAELTARLRTGIAQLERWEIDLKDPERGLVDFYHDRNGEVVYLCYLLGEDDIAWWHTLQGGFGGRQRI